MVGIITASAYFVFLVGLGTFWFAKKKSVQIAGLFVMTCANGVYSEAANQQRFQEIREIQNQIKMITPEPSLENRVDRLMEKQEEKLWLAGF